MSILKHPASPPSGKFGAVWGKGGGAAPPEAPTEQTVNQSNLPAYAQPYFERLLNRTEAESNTDYTPYTGDRIAEFNGDTTQSFDAVRDLQGTPAELTQASGIASGQGGFQSGMIESGYNGANIASTYSPQNFQTGTFDDATAQDYMDPYVTQVMDRMQARGTERFNEQKGARNSAAVEAGAFGGTRAAIVDGMAQRELNQQLSDIEGQQLSQAYQNAGQMFTSDQGRGLQAQGLTEESARAGAGMNLQAQEATDTSFARADELGIRGMMANEDARRGAAEVQLGASTQLGGIAQMGQQLGLQQADALSSVGGAQQAQTQQGLDIAETDFTNQRDFDRQQLNFYSSILRGVPISAQSEVSTYKQQPNQFSQLLGLGLGGLGAAREFG